MTDHDSPASPCFVCRCEEVTPERIAEAISAGATSLNDLKRRTRAGMGLCQGIYCIPEMVRILAGQTGRIIGEIEPMTARPPAGAVTLDALARSTE